MSDIDLTDWARDAARDIEDGVVGEPYMSRTWNIGEKEAIILRHADPLIAALQSAIEERDMLKLELERRTGADNRH